MQAIHVPSIDEIYEYAVSLAAKKCFRKHEPMFLTRTENGTRTRIAVMLEGNSEIEEVTLICTQDASDLPLLVVKKSPPFHQENSNASFN
jgi:hypothetical protein